MCQSVFYSRILTIDNENISYRILNVSLNNREYHEQQVPTPKMYSLFDIYIW